MTDQPAPVAVVVRAARPSPFDRVVGVGVGLGGAAVVALVLSSVVHPLFWLVLVALAWPFPWWRRSLARLVRWRRARLVVDARTLTVVNWRGQRRTLARSEIGDVRRCEERDRGFFDWQSEPESHDVTIIRRRDGGPPVRLAEELWPDLNPIWQMLAVTAVPVGECSEAADLPRLARPWAPLRERYPRLVQMVSWQVWMVGALLAVGLVMDAART